MIYPSTIGCPIGTGFALIGNRRRLGLRSKVSIFILSLLYGTQSLFSQTANYDVSGKNGIDGSSGTTYSTSSGSGSGRGSNGGDAGRSTPGQNAGSVELQLSDELDPSKPSRAQLIIRGSIQRANGQTENTQEHLDISSSSAGINISAQGGKGGDGGRGGNGQGGQNGSNGSDATRYSRGGNGGNGYSGGNGGDGTPGSNGGSGGSIAIDLSSSDLHLAFLLRSINVGGGQGGAEGSNGSGGSGGRGGSGGSSYSWREKTGTRQIKSKNSNGSVSIRSEDIYTSRSNSGGSNGSSGSSGYSGRGRTDAGNKGPDGSFVFRVKDTSGRVESYQGVSDLVLRGYTIEDQNKNGIIEPGEPISLTNITIENMGQMPSPAGKAQTLFTVADQSWLSSETAPQIIPSLKYREKFTFPNAFVLKISSAQAVGIGARWSRPGPVAPQANVTRVFHRYPHFDNTQNIEVTFPIEITPIDMPETLGAGEHSKISFKVRNISKTELGENSPEKRAIELSLRQSAGNDGAYRFETSKGWVNLKPGHIQRIANLKPNQELTIEGTLEVDPDAPPYTKFGFENELRFPDYGDQSGNLHPIQKNPAELRIGLPYRQSLNADLLLITNYNTERPEVLMWMNLAKKFGLTMDIWDTSYYGYLNLRKSLGPNQAPLIDHYKKKTVIVLNNKADRKKEKMGSDALDAEEFVNAGSQKSMNFYVIGGQGGVGFLKWLMTTDPDPNQKLPFDDELNGFENPSSSFAASVTAKATSNEKLRRQALKLSESLYEHFPKKRFALECPKPVNQDKTGEIWVKATIEPFKGKATYLSKSDEVVHNDSFVDGEDNIRGLFLTLNIHQKTELFNRLLSARIIPAPNSDRWIAQAILHDIIEEIETLRLVDDKDFQHPESAFNYQNLLHSLNKNKPIRLGSLDEKVQILAETFAGIELYLDAAPSSHLIKGLSKHLKNWKKENWKNIFGSDADKATSFSDSYKEKFKDQIKTRQSYLVGLSDVEQYRHLLIYPAKKSVKTTDEILKEGNWVE